MHNSANVVIVVLAVALALAVGWVLFHISRVVVSIVRDARSAGCPLRELKHSEFGTLTLDGELWRGKISDNDSDIRIAIAGNDAGPDATLIHQLHKTIAHLSDLEQMALEHIRVEEPDHVRGKFTLKSLDFLWEENPNAFSMEFLLAGDDDGVWRVEFESGRPKSVGRDD